MVTPRDAKSTRVMRVLDEAVAEELALLAVQAGWIEAKDADARTLLRLLSPEQVETLRARQRQRDLDRLQGRVSDTPDEVRDVEGEPERRFDRFVLLEKVGRGASGAVWKAWDPQVRRWVAIKVLAAEHPHARERFLREAHIAGTLRHPNLVTVHDAGDWQGRAYMVMEFIEGTPLVPSAQPEELAILRDAASAIGLAHRKGVVHRDLKPANILVDAGRVPHVVDFGLARDSAEAALTRTGMVVGTPLYMAPEQVRGGAQVSPRTDVYALGCILYESLTGKPPHLATSIPEVYSNILQRDPVPPRRLRPEIAPALERVCLKAIEREPSLRYADAAEFAEDLDRWLKGESVRARPAPLAVRARRAMKRYAIAGAVVAVAVAGGLYAWHRVGVSRSCAAVVAQARGLEEAGKFEEARDAYRRALGIDGSNASAREGLARLDKRAASRERGLKLAETARPALEQAQHLLYDATATPADIAGWVDRAEPLLKEAVELAPDAALTHFLAGWAAALRSREDLAEERWLKSVAADPGFAPAHLRLGKLHLWRAYVVTLGALPETVEECLAAARRHSEPARRHVEAAIAAGGGALDEMELALAECIVAMAEDRVLTEMPRRAKEALEKYRTRRGVEELMLLSAISVVGQARLDGLNAALGVRPHFPLALLVRAMEHRERGDVKAGLADAEHALALWPSMVEARFERAALLWRGGRLDEADADFEECARAGYRAAPSRLNQGLVRAALGRTEEALASYGEAIAHDPRLAKAWYARSFLHRKLGNLESALADLNRAIELDGSRGDWWNDRAVVRMARSEWAAAESDAREAVRLDGKNASAWRNLGALLSERGAKSEALKAYDCALEADPRYVRALFERACLRGEAGDRARAIEDAERVLRLLPAEETRMRGDAERLLARLKK